MLDPFVFGAFVLGPIIRGLAVATSGDSPSDMLPAKMTMSKIIRLPV